MAIERKVSKKKSLIAASLAGLMAVAGATMLPGIAVADEHCYGVNACKGTGDCGGKAHTCAGQNACKGQGYLKLADGVCAKIAGGSTTAPTE